VLVSAWLDEAQVCLGHSRAAVLADDVVGGVADGTADMRRRPPRLANTLYDEQQEWSGREGGEATEEGVSLVLLQIVEGEASDAAAALRAPKAGGRAPERGR
jgi:hypothetical protein